MSKFYTILAVLASAAVVLSATHVYMYKSDTKNYALTANPGPALPTGVIKHGGMLMTSTLAQFSGNSESYWVFGSGITDDQGRCGVVWVKDLNDTAGTVNWAYMRAEFRDGWAGNAFCNAGLIKLRVGVVDFQGNIEGWGTADDVPASAIWQDATNPLSGSMGYDMSTPTLMAEEIIYYIAPAGRAYEADDSKLDKKFATVDVTDQVNWILAHTGANKGNYSGNYAIVFLTKPSEGSVGKVNTLTIEECNVTNFYSDAPWTTDGNSAHLVVSFDNAPVPPSIAVEKSAVKVSLKSTLVQNQPNPFTGTTAISYNTGSHAKGMITVYDAAGKAVFARAVKGSGLLSWNASGLSNGLYMCRLVTGNETLSRNIILMK